MASEKLRNIRKYLLRNARALDVARWSYHFEDGDTADVLKALYAYQNRDGGFGHGLEPDNQNPHSTPVATWSAVEILREIGFPAEAERMIRQTVRYLGETDDYCDNRWRATVAENETHPHAPWWSYAEDDGFRYNPTAALIGFLWRFADPTGEAFARAEAAYAAMVPDIADPRFIPERHELCNFLTLIEDAYAVGIADRLPVGFEEAVRRWVNAGIDRAPELYRADHYVASPDLYISGKQSPYYSGNEAICDFYADYIESQFSHEGAWPIPWTWGNEPLPDSVRRDWEGILAVDKMLFLQRMQE